MRGLGRIGAWLMHPAGRGAAIGLLCALAAGMLAQVPPLAGLEEWLHDGLYTQRGQRASAARIVLVALDDASLDELGKPAAYLSPELARAVRFLTAQGARAIGIDLLVPERLATLPEIENPGGLGEAAPLGEAIAESGRVVLPWALGAGAAGRPLTQWRLAEFRDLLQPDPPRIPLHLAFVDMTEDDDQFIRRQALLTRFQDAIVPHFALALAARARGQPIHWDDDHARLRLGDDPIPLDAEQTLRIHYLGPPGTVPRITLREVLRAESTGTALPQLAGAIAIIGVVARGQQDYHSTPYANRYTRSIPGGEAGLMAGAELHAHTVATLLDGAYVRTPAFLSPWAWLLGMGALLGWVFRRSSLELGLALAAGHHLLWKAWALTAFVLAGWRVPMLAMLMLGGLCYGVSFALRWRAMRRMLGVVNSEAVARQFEGDPRRLGPGGEEVTLTVLFADIRSFTSFAEKHEPREVVALLNAYFAAIVPALEKRGGVVNRYIGDGIMVLFGVPAEDPRHAEHAVDAARVIVRKVHAARERWAALGFPDLKIGVGIHTGPAVVGCVGSRNRLDYTAIGDTINAAARIEPENKRLGTEILISAATYAAIPSESRTALGCEPTPIPMAVKGKDEELQLHPVRIDAGRGDGQGARS